MRGSVVAAHGFSSTWHVEPSQTRHQTGIPCIARPILNHWTTREALFSTSHLQPSPGSVKLLFIPTHVSSLCTPPPLWSSHLLISSGSLIWMLTGPPFWSHSVNLTLTIYFPRGSQKDLFKKILQLTFGLNLAKFPSHHITLMLSCFPLLLRGHCPHPDNSGKSPHLKIINHTIKVPLA